MIRKVGVLYGGVSAEREVSLHTGAAVIKAVRKLGYECIAIDVNESFLHNLDIPEMDVAFIALHGRMGEDGTIQSVLQLKGIPFCGSGVPASAIAINKKFSKYVFAATNTPTADYEILNSPASLKRLTFPVIIKPINEGSSIGMAIVRDSASFEEAVREALKYDAEVLVEKFIDGREFTVAMLNGEPLPVIEILPKREFYDYTAKYTKGLTDFEVPAKIDSALSARLKEVAVKTFNALGCADFGRVDIIVRDGELFVLEINTIPGMTETSLLPKAAAAAGISFEEMIDRIVKYAYKK